MHAPSVCVCVVILVEVKTKKDECEQVRVIPFSTAKKSCLKNSYIYIESPHTRLELAPSKAPSISIITRHFFNPQKQHIEINSTPPALLTNIP